MRPPLPVALITALLIASKGPDAPPPKERELPWLRGFPADAYTDEATPAAEARLHGWQAATTVADAVPDADAACTTTARGALALAADVAPAPGIETVLASYTSGVIVLDARGHKLASLPPLTCRGSIDTIESLTAGDLGLGAPVIALAATAGGRAERTTWMYLLVVRGERLAPVFAAPVEEWRGTEVSTGELALGPGGALRYRAPDGAVGTWAYDRTAGRFVLLRSSPPPPPPPPMAPGPAA
jgi:hypothetical protein